MFRPRHYQKLSLKRVGRYLKGTKDKLLMLNPSSYIFNIYCFSNADFSGIYGHENPIDPLCVKRRTFFVIIFTNFPLLWQSKLRTYTDLSTMESEVINLAHGCRGFFTIIYMDNDLSGYFGLTIVYTTKKVSVHEDNSGAFVFPDILPP